MEIIHLIDAAKLQTGEDTLGAVSCQYDLYPPKLVYSLYVVTELELEHYPHTVL